MTDIELHALAVLVEAESARMSRYDAQHLADGHVGGCYGDTAPDGLSELRAELARRGIFKE